MTRRGLTLRRARILFLASTLVLVTCSDSTEPNTPESLVFAVQPTSTGEGGLLAPPITVSVRDEGGNTVPGWDEEVTLTLEGGNPSAGLLGSIRASTLAGLAIFPDLRVDGIGSDFVLRANSGRLTQGVSDPFTIHGVFQAASLYAGESHGCALTEDGTAYCWGRNYEGQLGTGDIQDRFIPTLVSTGLRFMALAPGGRHTCALSTENGVHCWGSNEAGELGVGNLEDSTVPVPVSLPGAVRSVDSGYWHSCALLETGDAYCWGHNGGGALGIGVADSLRATPVLVSGGHAWAVIETGYLQTCGLTTAGEAYCWGPNIYGENGVGELRGDYHAPTPVLGNHRFTSLVAGGGPCHGETCGVTTGGTVLCWGKNYQREVGPSDFRSWLEPTPLVGDPGFTEVMVGPAMVCGYTEERELSCLGNPIHGMLPYAETPIPLVADMEVTSLAMGQTLTCVTDSEGSAYCWGSNEYGQMGSAPTSLGSTVPVPVWDPGGE